MKLLNAMASLNKGRNYLLAKDSLLDDVVQIMIREKEDSELRQNCLGTIQKFTLRSKPQNRLIELNVIHYIVDIFTYQGNNLSDYTVEYGLALIMNLSLRKAGRDKFESVAEKTLKILSKFMDKDSFQMQTCINGTLYSLLKKKRFKEEAQKLNLESILTSCGQNNPQLQKQISYILEELHNPPVVEDTEFEENLEEDINAIDEEENTVDEYADADSIDGNLFEEHYKVLGEFIIRNREVNRMEEERIRKFMESNVNMVGIVGINKSQISNNLGNTLKQNDCYNDYKPIRRPTTPMSNLSMTGNSQFFKAVVKAENPIHTDIPEDSAKAFMKKDKIKRTPPRNYNK